ncbi:expressed unknown protein [Seminavis robusta]|uniref:Uncharacterized protein n=1 Tax=Seminavis robusta TaxID=568900 RepID=A0A9N8D452_9STRA|nr:expressed unknown protein [Seminavis robusta]|eukprot:Sro1_g000320.1 n/a (608) ;mRNA; r:93475-95395
MARRKRRSAENNGDSPVATTASSLQDTVLGYWQRFLTLWRSRPLHYRVGAVVLLVAAILLFVGDFGSTNESKLRQQQQAAATTSSWRQNWKSQGISNNHAEPWLVPGDLPGYTGWARPATTLAKYFQLDPKSVNKPVVAGKPWELTVWCMEAEDCASGGALFFVRAYGPAVLTGHVQDNKDGSYKITLLPKDPGPYTLEVVLTFSNPDHMGQFPLPDRQPEPAYEGYLLPGFPIPFLVVDGDKEEYKSNNGESHKSLPVCEMERLLETSATSAWEKARWVVTDKINQPNHVDDHHYKDTVTFPGYEVSQNSLGIMMDYRHDTCRILPHIAPKHPQNPLNKCTEANGPLHFIFIGDSNMRLQRNLFETMFLGLPEDQREKSRYNEHMIRASYHDLTGGALRCNLIGGNDKNVTRFFQTILARKDEKLEKPERYVVLFNTGMHDIHRLCSHEFAADRLTYLGDAATDASKGFHCVMHYRYAIEGLATEVLNFPADLRVFQSTTAGWPKYGNWGVFWPTEGAQNMPVATEFIDFFNDIAYEVMKDSFPTIPVMDGYWVSYARPDNREVSSAKKKALEKKLSHPGVEVVSAMLRTWTTIVAQSELCEEEEF